MALENELKNISRPWKLYSRI